MKSRLNLKPGQKGTKKMVEEYGSSFRLVLFAGRNLRKGFWWRGAKEGGEVGIPCEMPGSILYGMMAIIPYKMPDLK